MLAKVAERLKTLENGPGSKSNVFFVEKSVTKTCNEILVLGIPDKNYFSNIQGASYGLCNVKRCNSFVQSCTIHITETKINISKQNNCDFHR